MIGGAVSASSVAISYVNDLSASAQAQINALRDGSATARFAALATTAISASSAAALGGTAASGFPTLAGFNTFTFPYGLRKSTSAYEMMHATSAPTGERGWIVNYATASGTLVWAAMDDSNTYVGSVLVLTRDGTTLSSVDWYADVIRLNGQDLSNPTQLNSIPAASYARLDNAQTFGKGTGSTVVSTSPAASVSPNMTSGNVHRIILNQNISLTAPTAPRSGQTLVLMLIQDGTGSRTATFSSVYNFPGGVAPTLSTAAGARDVFAFVYDDIYAGWFAAGLSVS